MIQRELQNPLATKILAGEILPGQTVRAGVGEGGLVLGAGAPAGA